MFYIGSSINLVDRAKYHRNKLRKIIQKYLSPQVDVIQSMINI